MTTKTKRHLMQELVTLAEVTVRRHVEDVDGEMCFNLFTFLEGLELKLEDLFGGDGPNGRFELDPSAIARLLWCHLALGSGDAPDGCTFRGMPTLD